MRPRALTAIDPPTAQRYGRRRTSRGVDLAKKTAATLAPELDQAWIEDFATRSEAAWNSQPARLFELMTDNIVYDDSAWPARMRGHGDVRSFLDYVWRAFPDLRVETIEGPYIVPGQPKAASHWRGTGTHTGLLDPPGLAPTGNRVEFEGADLHEYREGRICRLRIVFDMLDLGRQLGALPEADSPVAKAGAAAQRLGINLRERLRR